ncbi:MAG TPA: carboxypeptidase regulatory-like domain-containing protein [Bryobacteraceae bacterium]|nr:carboxypeptidase regulatory-like domain-containing protein [Bryobacteraceae bacterium]
MLFVLVLAMSVAVYAQTPTGIISGAVTDESGAVVPNATVTITNKTTGFTRTVTTNAEGLFSAPALPAGEYEVRAELTGFRTTLRQATVQAGDTTSVNLPMQVGGTKDVVTVEGVAPQINYENHSIEGVITRQKIEGLPLNGRSFMQLASIEPGVTVSAGTTSQYNTLVNISVLGGASGLTAISVDGGPLKDDIEGAGTSMNFSQEVVQEFQLSALNFDLSTDITSVGSVNVVTRQGGNQFHGSGYFFFRDHNMAAYPGLKRNALSPDPFFARRNPGFWLGGPILKDKLFFFFNYEYMNQVQAFTVQPDIPSVAGLANTFGSPYHSKTLSLRFDYRLSSKHTLFARYSHDGNQGLGPNGGSPFPSSWLKNVNWADQTAFGVTSILKSNVVNDFRFTYAYWHNRNLFPTSGDCGQNCLGLGFPQLTLVGSSNFQVGDTSNATQGRDLRRFTFQDSLTWQMGSHRIRFGALLEHNTGTGFWGYCDPACAVAYSPEFLTKTLTAPGVAAFFPNLPKVITSNADLLALPFAGASIGLGDPSQPPPFNIDTAKINNRYRFYGQDTWKITPKITLNYGLAWEYESNLFNEDLAKPAFLAPLYGSDLSPTHSNTGNFSPSLGFAWNVGNNNKTVIRAGAGLYYDTEQLYRRLQERSEIGPLGNGRILEPSTQYTNIFPGIINVGVTAATGKVSPIPVGALLPSAAITNLTLGQFLQILAQQTPILQAALTPTNKNDLTIRPIDISKSGSQLVPRNYPVQHSYHMSVGMQRELRHDLVLNVDFVRRVFIDELYSGGNIDLNLFNRTINGVQSPIIPICPAAQRNTPGVECSNGAISFWVPGARQTYTAMLVKADKRLSNRYQFTASYALQSEKGVNGIQNLSNYTSSWGPQAGRQLLNVVGIVDLPWGLQLGFISTMASRGPIMPVISGIDINGNGSGVTPLPGLSYNCLNLGCGKSELEAAVASWNSTYAGKKDLAPNGGKTIPSITLPANYRLGRPFDSQDLRLTKTFTLKERYKFAVLAEMFNVFNYQNYQGYNFDPSSGVFGIPTQRAGQTFGSGGPRAVQLGARVSF